MAQRTGSGAPAAAEISSSEGSLADGRLQLLGRLGEGSFGEVFEAIDHAHGTRVALKVLRRAGPDALVGFKREFRAVADLHHRNLVRLGELFEDEGLWFFTMEKITGQGFLDYVRPGGELAEARLRRALVQVARGLCALHGAGKLHRDVKPSNVVVDETGRAVLLDLGLVRNVDEGRPTELGPVGTMAYMSPEQAACRDQGPSSDCYAMGAMLFEALTGQLPLSGVGLDLLLAKQERDAPPVRQLAPDAPEDLATLCDELLQREGERRPTASQVLRRLQGNASAEQDSRPSTHTAGVTGRSFVGRTEELLSLERALEPVDREELSVALIEGASGIGKTQLAAELLTRVHSDPRAVVLQGRCYERETVPFKALDGVVDALARYLHRIDDDSCRALMPRRVGALLRIFPVLSRIQTMVDAASRAAMQVDQLALRASGFSALRELLQRLSERHRLVVAIDDLQWADAESLALLEELLRPPDPPALLLLCTARMSNERSEEVDSGLKNLLQLSPHAQLISLTNLARDEAEALARQLLPEASQALAPSIAERSEGHPIFVEALAQHAALMGDESPPDLDEALLFRLSELNDPARDLLRTSAVAGVPVAVQALARAARLDPDQVPSAVAQLRAQRLVRLRRGQQERMVIGHDRIRTALVRFLDTRERREINSRLARALQATGNADAEGLSQHYMEAGEYAEAARCARDAARAAVAALAFDKAARMYETALELEPDAPDAPALRVKLAQALYDAGRGERAAEVFLRASKERPEDALELRRRAAESMLQSGRLEEGIRIAGEVLQELGVGAASSTRGALASGLYNSVRGRFAAARFAPADVSAIPQDELTRIDMLSALAPAIGPLDAMRGFDYSARAQLLALRAGEPGRAAVGIAGNVWGLYFSGRHGAIRKALSRAREFADLSGDPRTHGQVLFFESMMKGLVQGDPEGCLVGLHDAERTMQERCTGVNWLVTSIQQAILSWQIQTARTQPLSVRYPRVMREAKERGHIYALSQLALSAGWYDSLIQDAPHTARARVEIALAEWPRSQTGPEALLRLMAELGIAMYEADLERIEAAFELWEPLEKRGLMRRGVSIPFLWTLRASAALTAADLDPARAEHFEQLATRAASRLAALAMPGSLTDGRRELVQAALAARAATPGTAVDMLHSAQQRFARDGSRGLELAAGYRAAQLQGDEQTQQSSVDLLRRASVVDPARMFRVLAPPVLRRDA